MKRGGITCSGSLEQGCISLFTCSSVCNSGINRRIWGKPLVFEAIFLYIKYSKMLSSLIFLGLVMPKAIKKTTNFTNYYY